MAIYGGVGISCCFCYILIFSGIFMFILVRYFCLWVIIFGLGGCGVVQKQKFLLHSPHPFQGDNT